MDIRYLVSLPERILRAIPAAGGGLIYETTEVLLPEWLRGVTPLSGHRRRAGADHE